MDLHSVHTHTPCTPPTHCSYYATHPQRTDRTSLAICLHSDCALPTHCPRAARTLPEPHDNLPTQSHPPPALNCPSAHCPHTAHTIHTHCSYSAEKPLLAMCPHTFCPHTAGTRLAFSPQSARAAHSALRPLQSVLRLPARCRHSACSRPTICPHTADTLLALSSHTARTSRLHAVYPLTAPSLPKL
jgi:hypothetical protein